MDGDLHTGQLLWNSNEIIHQNTTNMPKTDKYFQYWKEKIYLKNQLNGRKINQIYYTNRLIFLDMQIAKMEKDMENFKIEMTQIIEIKKTMIESDLRIKMLRELINKQRYATMTEENLEEIVPPLELEDVNKKICLAKISFEIGHVDINEHIKIVVPEVLCDAKHYSIIDEKAETNKMYVTDSVENVDMEFTKPLVSERVKKKECLADIVFEIYNAISVKIETVECYIEMWIIQEIEEGRGLNIIQPEIYEGLTITEYKVLLDTSNMDKQIFGDKVMLYKKILKLKESNLSSDSSEISNEDSLRKLFDGKKERNYYKKNGKKKNEYKMEKFLRNVIRRDSTNTKMVYKHVFGC